MSFAFCCFAYFYFYYVLLKQCCQLVLRWWYCFKITKQKRFRNTHFTYLVIKFSLSFFFYGICHRLTDVNRNIFFQFQNFRIIFLHILSIWSIDIKVIKVVQTNVEHEEKISKKSISLKNNNYIPNPIKNLNFSSCYFI